MFPSPYNRYGASLANMAPSYNPMAYGAAEGQFPTPPGMDTQLSQVVPGEIGYLPGPPVEQSTPYSGVEGVYSAPPPEVPLSQQPLPGPLGSPESPQMTYPTQALPYTGDSHGPVIPGGLPVPGGPHPGMPPPPFVPSPMGAVDDPQMTYPGGQFPPLSPGGGLNKPLSGDSQFPPLSGSTALAAQSAGQNRYGKYLGERQSGMRNYLNPSFGSGRL